MLPDPLRLLISAYAAGDLNPRRRSAAVRLLRHSAEARRLLKDLRHQRRQLRLLPGPPLPADFAERVVNALPERPIIQPAAIIRPGGSRVTPAAHWAAASVVLLAVAMGAYLIAALPRDPSGPVHPVAKRAQPSPTAEIARVRAPEPEPTDVGPPAQAPVSKPADVVVTNAPTVSSDPAPTTTSPDPLGTPSPLPQPFNKVMRPGLFAGPLRGLDKVDARAQFEGELRRGDAHHIDLFCRDTAKALERVEAVLKGHGVRLVVDVAVQESLKRKLRPAYVVYCDDLSAKDWGRVMNVLAAGEKSGGERVFGSAVMFPFDLTDAKDLTTIAGADLSLPESRRPGANGSESRRSHAKNGKQALVASMGPQLRTSANSKEVKQFVAGHDDRRPDAIAVVLRFLSK